MSAKHFCSSFIAGLAITTYLVGMAILMVEILLFCFADEQNLHAADAPLSLLNVLAVIKHFGRLLYVPKDQMEFECCDKDLTGPVTSLFILREWEPTFYKVGLGCDILSSIFGLLLFASLLGSETSLKELKNQSKFIAGLLLLSNVLAHFIFYFLGKSWCLVPLSFLFPLSLFQLLFKWKESGRFRKNGKVLGSNYPTIYPGTVFLHQITALPANDYSHYSCPSWQGLAACNNAYEEPKKQPSDSFNESFAYVAHNEIVCETAVSNQISAFNSPNTDAKDPPPLYPSIPDNTDLGYIDPKC